MKKNSPAPDLSSRILRELSAPSYAPLDTAGLARRLRLAPAERSRLGTQLGQLESSGAIVRVKGDRWVLPKEADLVTGAIQFRSSGSAFVLNEGADGPREVNVSQEDTGVALHGDRVVARLHRGGLVSGPRGAPSGRVIRILSRARESIVGTLRRSRVAWHVVPDDPRFVQDLIVPDPARARLRPTPREGDKVVARLLPWEHRHANPEGEIVEVLGRTQEPGAELKAILRHYQLDEKFPPAVESAARAMPVRVPPADLRGRVDLRQQLVITIDPDDAKDFDDALSLEDLGGGRVRVGVHIADVSHYVKPRGPLDAEARKRGNSTYLVGVVVPMLPESLSNGLCSLVEGEDRLTQSVFLTYDRSGRLAKTEYARSVIRSRKRLTYRQAFGLLREDRLPALRNLPSPPAHDTRAVGRPLASLSDGELQELQRIVRALWSVASVLRRARFQAGALDLDMPEVRIRIDAEGYACELERVEHDESHQLVEEFMLAANEAVAKALRQKRTPTLYRVHDDPDADRLAEFAKILAASGLMTGDLGRRQEVCRVLALLRDHPQGPALRIQFLRSLRKAGYRPSPDGHYGLSKKDYLHFTSPIRRYADLVVHRSYAALTEPSVQVPSETGDLRSLAEHLCGRESASMEAERDHKRVKLVEYFSRELDRPAKSRTRFAAVATDIRNHGFFVDLPEAGATGLVHVSSLKDDFYQLDATGSALVGRKTKRRFALGERVTVIVDRVDRIKRQIDFCVVD